MMHENDDPKTTTYEHMLEKISHGVEHIKSSSDLDKVMISELKRTVSDHDRAIIIMSKAVEDTNKNSAEMTSVFKDFQKETLESQRAMQDKLFEHWKTQDKIMAKVENLLESMNKNENRFQKIEDRQLSGCPSLKNFEGKRDAELKHWEDVKKTLITATQKNREEINKLSEQLS